MTFLPKPEVILTHESDLDGLLSGLLLQRLARKMHGEEITLQGWNYQGWRNRQLSEYSAWVADFSYETRLNRQDWVLFDHHVSATPPKKDDLKLRLFHDVNKSAASLCYELCREHGLASPALDRLTHLNNVADLWIRDDPDFELAIDYSNLVKTYGFWNLCKVVDGDPERLLNHPLLEVMTVKRKIEDPLGYEWSLRNIEEINADIAVVHTTIGNTNLIVHQLLERGAVPYKVLVTLFPKANRTIVASFRSMKGEALAAASKLQGGGHPNAAGTTLPKSVTDIDTAVTFLRTTLQPPAPGRNPVALANPFAVLEGRLQFE
jgi:hypothetical protein